MDEKVKGTDRGMNEYEIIKSRYGIAREESVIKEPRMDSLFVVEDESGLPEEFLGKLPNVMTKKRIRELEQVSELIHPEIPMLINTIENCYCKIAVYGKSDYAKKIYGYLKGNPHISLFWIEEDDFKYQISSGGGYFLNSKDEVDMLLVMDLLLARDVYDASGRRIVTVFAQNMYRADLKSTCNYADVDKYILPYLAERGVKVIWIEKPDANRVYDSKKIQTYMKAWDVIKRIDIRLFLLLKHIKFHTLYLWKESQSAVFTNAKGIGEVYFNGKYINFDNGFRRTPGNSDRNQNNVWLFGACNVRAVGIVDLDDDHTLSAALQRKVAGEYNVINKGSVRSCLNYVMRMTKYKQGDIAVFFSSDYVPAQKNEKIHYIDSTDIFNRIPHLKRHITDVLFHCDEVVIEEIAKDIHKKIEELRLPQSSASKDEDVFFGSSIKREPSKEMYEKNKFITWLDSLDQYKCEGNNGAIVMNANPFTLGHRHLVEYAASQVDHLYIMVVEEDKSFFSFKERYQLVKEGTADLQNVTVFPSSQYVISKSSLPGYFEKDTMKGDFLLDASQDILSFVQAARVLNINVRFCGEEPNDRFTEQYNTNMKKMLPEYGIRFQIIPRKERDGNVISASRVREFIKQGNLEAVRTLVPETTYQYILRRGR